MRKNTAGYRHKSSERCSDRGQTSQTQKWLQECGHFCFLCWHRLQNAVTYIYVSSLFCSLAPTNHSVCYFSIVQMVTKWHPDWL